MISPALSLKTAFLGVLIATAGCCQMLAQSQPDTVDLSLVCLDRMPSSLLLQMGNGELVPVATLAGLRNPVVRYRGSPPFRFFTETTDAEGRVTRIPAATVSYQADWPRALIILAPAPRGAAEPLRGQAFDDSPAGFPPEHVRVFNLHPFPLAIHAGTNEPVQLEPGQSALQPLTVDRTGRAFVQLAMRRGDLWQVLPPLGTDVLPNMRALAFLYEENGQASRALILDVINPEFSQEERSPLRQALHRP